MKRWILIVILFLTAYAHSQPNIYYHAVKCAGQESVITIDSLSGISLPVEFSLNGQPFQYENRFYGEDAGFHSLVIRDPEHVLFSFEIEVTETPSPQFRVEEEYLDCYNNALISITDIKEGNPPYFIYMDNELTTESEVIVHNKHHRIRVEDVLGCTSETNVFLKSKCFVPYNAITPNGDGLNDFWEIPQLEVFPDAQVTVFNKWGQKLYTASSPFTPWSGDNHPMATYYYVIQLNGKNDDENIITGDLTIIR